MGRLRRCWEWSRSRSDRFWRECGYPECHHRAFPLAWRRRAATRMEGKWFCTPNCLQASIERRFRSAVSAGISRRPSDHRVPLGLLMLSRGDLTESQLRRALDEQRLAGRGRIGSWLQELGFSTEQQVLSALSVQYACPIQAFPSDPGCCQRVPWPLLMSMTMVPVRFVPASQTLYVAFCAQVDHALLRALEHMLGCRTTPCLVSDRVMSHLLEGAMQAKRSFVYGFENISSLEEATRIAGSYALRIEPEEVRVATAGQYLWVRLSAHECPIDLLFRVPSSWEQSTAIPQPKGDFGSSVKYHARLPISLQAAVEGLHSF